MNPRGQGSRTFVVTGCAGGIGRALTETLLDRGHRVVATDVRVEPLQAAADAGAWPADRAQVVALDVRDPAAWETVMDRAVQVFGGVDVLMNVAGYLKPGWVLEADPVEVDRHFDVNTKGVILGTRAAARRMVAAAGGDGDGDGRGRGRGRGAPGAATGGHIVNVASMAALAPVPGLALYCASKYAVRAFSLAMAHELRPHGIAVTVVCPDAVRTPMLDLQKDYAEAALTFSGPRILSAQEVVDVLAGRVLQDRPLEVVLPPSRGAIARMADLFPGLGFRLAPFVQRAGRARQGRYRKQDG